MRQTHPAGERLFVDYAAPTVEVIDAVTGEVRRAQIFGAALGASNFTYAEARWTQALPAWIGCHVGRHQLRRCRAADRLRQSQRRCHRRVSLRAGDQQDLPGHGRPLRHRRFFSLTEINGAIRELIADLNDRPMRHLGTSRGVLLEVLECKFARNSGSDSRLVDAELMWHQ
jgi:hypothetical protein